MLLRDCGKWGIMRKQNDAPSVQGQDFAQLTCVRWAASLALAFSMVSGGAIASVSASQPPKSSVLSRLPVEFEENKGQFDPSVKYLARAAGYRAFLTSAGMTIALPSGQGAAERSNSLVGIKFQNSRGEADIVGEALSEHKTNYFVGESNKESLVGISNFGRVVYHEVYSGIDAVFYQENGRVEYDFRIRPGADPSVIELAYDGVKGIEIDRDGDLLLHTAAGTLKQHRPVIFQELNGQRESVVPATYALPPESTATEIFGAFVT